MLDLKEVILEQARRYDSFYLYDERGIDDAVHRLKTDLGAAEFLYSLKANPHPAVAESLFAHGLGADAASLAEVEQAHRSGLGPERIHYSAPGKRTVDLEGALERSTLIADSLEEIALIQRLAAARRITAKIGVRINPGFTFAGDGGQPSKFGIDEALAFQAVPAWKALPNVRIAGIHVHLRSQELHAPVLEGYYRRVLALAAAFQKALGEKLKFVNLGSGLGIPYGEGDHPLDTKDLGRRTARLAEVFRERLPGARLILETGRYAVGKSGYYVTRVLDRKESMGTTFLILSNTLNGFLRPCLAQLVANYAGDGVPAGSEPLFTGVDAFPCEALTGEGPEETVTLVGNLCTASDVIARDVTLPRLQRGDLVVVKNAGSYGAVLSPMQFSSQPPPAQLFLSRAGVVPG